MHLHDFGVLFGLVYDDIAFFLQAFADDVHVQPLDGLNRFTLTVLM